MPAPMTSFERAEILRLRNEHGMSCPAIADEIGRDKSTIEKFVTGAIRAGLTQPLPPRNQHAGDTWTDASAAELTALWSSNLSASEIGRKLGISKNAVIGKAHRLGLPPRPSPIKQGVKRPERIVPRLPIPSAEVICMPHVERPAEITFSPVPMPNPRDRGESAKTCMWPHGDPKKPGFHFCGAPTTPNRRRAPYCELHFGRAYQPALGAPA